MSRPRDATTFATLFVLAALIVPRGVAAIDCAAQPANQPLDLDGDGAADSVCVSDFDGDGSLEMDDIQQAADTLLDSGLRTVHVLPGSYGPPAVPATWPGRTHALVELTSHTVLECSSVAPGVLLQGPAGIGQEHRFAVVGNDDHANGNDGVVIRGCEIHGGAPDAYDGREVAINSRMGVYLRRTRNSVVEGNHVHHTFHTGLYTSNSTGDRFVDNLVEDAGGFGNTAPFSTRWRYPCIYVYAYDGGVAEDFVASGNTLRRCAANGLNARSEGDNSLTDVIRNVIWEDNLIETTGHSTGEGGQGPGARSKCVTVRGVEGLMLRRNECRDAGGLFLYGASGWRGDGDDEANVGIEVEDLALTDVRAFAGVYVGRYNENVTLRNVVVEHTREADGSYLPIDCMRVDTPLRGALFEDVTLRYCGAEGLVQGGAVPSGRVPEEELTFRRITVRHVDMTDPVGGGRRAGIHFRDAHWTVASSCSA